MFFSEHYSILRTSADDWFDPILDLDTPLFIDPFLVFKDREARWRGAHGSIVAHFQQAFELLARAGCDPHSQHFRAAVRTLQFPEPAETCLGYTANSTRGSGSGKRFAGFMAGSMCDAISRGVVQLRHFEELGILEEGIGPDRISDITTTILKPELIAYTQEVAGVRGVPLVEHRVRAGAFDKQRHGFVTVRVSLPTNPVTGGPLLLVPQRFLRDLPTINSDDWWDDMRSTELRDELNLELGKRVKKKEIVALAKRHPEKVAAWVRAREAEGARPYDLARDPNGVYAWSAATSRYAREHPVELPAVTSEAEFLAVIEKIVGAFRHFVEAGGGWRLLWDGDEEKPESAIQLLFHGIAKAYCQANNIVVDREVELGRGPVDFKFSSGYRFRALLEVKKLENGRFWHGLQSQLPSYLDSDQCTAGWLLAVRFRTEGVAAERAASGPREVRRTGEELGLDLRWALVDARPKLSASRAEPPPAAGAAGAA